jgi:hypothetical protein
MIRLTTLVPFKPDGRDTMPRPYSKFVPSGLTDCLIIAPVLPKFAGRLNSGQDTCTRKHCFRRITGAGIHHRLIRNVAVTCVPTTCCRGVLRIKPLEKPRRST